MELYEHQVEGLKKLKNGSVLVGGTGSGKSRVALAYYYTRVLDGKLKINGDGEFKEPTKKVNLYIITPAVKRDNKEWEDELSHFLLSVDKDNIVIDSWNNIQKYKDVYGSFFIFDEQHVTGHGKWSKSFIKICRRNRWILLSATPGDKWEDYTSLFIANGLIQNKTEFEAKYCVFSPYVRYKKIQRYLRENELERMRDSILVIMKDNRVTEQHHIYKICDYDKEKYQLVWKYRWDPYESEPIEEITKAMYLIRRVVNSDDSRFEVLEEIFEQYDRVIIFYNFTYELELLRDFLDYHKIKYSERNGQKHEKIRESKRWAYLVQYASGGEAWNCTESNCIVFFSQTYSYKQQEQACGRIDRMNTAYKDLYYYHLRSQSNIDRAIYRALINKKDFNERAFYSK